MKLNGKSRLSPKEPPRYSRTILNLLEKFSQVSYVPSVAGIVEDTSRIERRTKMIAKFKKTSRTRSVATVLLVAILACLSLTDAYPAGPPLSFGTPENLGATVNSAHGEGICDLSSDGLELYFESDRPGGRGDVDIWVTTRKTVTDPWEPPVNLGTPVNGPYAEAAPSMSHDGLVSQHNAMESKTQ